MVEYQFYNGQYPFPLNNVLTDGGDFIKTFIPGNPELAIPEEDNFYVICCTPEQMNKIMSSIEVGAPIVFPNLYNDVLQLVQQAYEFPNSFEGSDCMDLCQMIADCIDTSDAVKSSIINLTSVVTEDLINIAAQQNSGLGLSGGDNPECDEDKWWSACIQTVQRMNRVNTDAFEILEVNTNIWDGVTNVIGNFSGFDESSLDAVAAWIQYTIDNIQENYAAQYTTAYEEEVACDLFCLAIDACELTPQMIVNYFGGRLAATLNFDTIWYEILNYLVTGTWSGTEIVDFMMASQLAFRAWFDTFFTGISFTDIGIAVRLGFSNPSSDWSIICDTCPATPIRRLGGYGNADITTAPLGGAAAMTWNSTFDLYRGTYSGDGLNAFGDLRFTLSEETDVDVIRVQLALHRTRGVDYNAGILYVDGVNVLEQEIVMTPDPIIMTWEYSTPTAVTEVKFIFGLGTVSPSNGGADITSIFLQPSDP